MKIVKYKDKDYDLDKVSHIRNFADLGMRAAFEYDDPTEPNTKNVQLIELDAKNQDDYNFMNELKNNFKDTDKYTDKSENENVKMFTTEEVPHTDEAVLNRITQLENKIKELESKTKD
jgi:hypothetical protein